MAEEMVTMTKADLEKAIEAGVDKAASTRLAEITKASRLAQPVDNGVAGAGVDKSIFRIVPTGLANVYGAQMYATKCEHLGSETKEFLKAFVGGIRAGQFKAMGEVPNTAGGYLIPGEFIDAIMEKVVLDSYFMRYGRVIPMTQDIISIPMLDQTFGSSADYFAGISWTYVGEGGTISESSNPAFKAISLKAKKAVGLQIFSSELASDRPDFAAYLVDLVGRSFGWHTDEMWWRGNGVEEPLGILVNPDRETVARVVAAHATIRDLINLDSAMDEAFTNPTIFARKATINDVPIEEDTVEQPKVKVIYMDPSQAWRPPTLIGYPLVRTKHAEVLGTEGDVVLADPSGTLIGLRKTLELTVSNEYRFDTDQVTMRWIARHDIRTPYLNAIQILTDHA